MFILPQLELVKKPEEAVPTPTPTLPERSPRAIK